MSTPELRGAPSGEGGFVTMSLLDHLDELRRRLVRVVAGVAIAFAICYWQSAIILTWCQAPFRAVVDEPLSVISVGEGFFVEMRASFLAALFVSAPWTLWQVWGFVSPGLYARERRLAIPFVFFTSLFFIAGGAFGYYVGWPAILDYLIGTASQGYEKNIRAQGYMDLLTKVLLGMGLVFEAPVLSAFLARLGLVSAGWLLRYWKHAMVGIAILAAFITPSGDIPTMVVFAVPMVLLYLVSVAVAWALGRRRGTASGA